LRDFDPPSAVIALCHFQLGFPVVNFYRFSNSTATVVLLKEAMVLIVRVNAMPGHCSTTKVVGF